MICAEDEADIGPMFLPWLLSRLTCPADVRIQVWSRLINLQLCVRT